MNKGILAAFVLLTLVSCGPQPIKSGPSQPIAQIALEDMTKFIESTDELAPEVRAKKLLDAVESLYKYNELDWARNVLSSLNPNELYRDDFVRYSMHSANLSLAEGKPFIAKHSLFNQKFQNELPLTTPALKISAINARASLLFNLGEFKESVTERLILDGVPELDELATESNQDLLWEALMEMPVQTLEEHSRDGQSRITAGWYTLAALSKNSQTDLKAQLDAVENWAMLWPEHPASLRLPADLQLLKELVETQPQKIAILLPLSSKTLEQAAEAIRDGILAAHYKTTSNSSFSPLIRIYDSSNIDINEAYDQAINEGAEVIIGPLNKPSISELSLRPELPVPTLALNYIDTPLGEVPNLYQFGLAVEDEAQQIANRAWLDGHRRALVLAPSSQWGDRSIASFSSAWTAQGGEIVGNHRFKAQKEYSRLIKEALQVSDSQNRAKQLRRTLRTNIEFEPRRRKDIDIIVLIAHPSQARQLKPTLAFHYAGSIPVYATSHIYNGKENPEANADMNSVRFTSLPWFFETERQEKQEIDAYANKSATYDRLYALGVDAYYLYPRLRQLDQVRQAHFYGATGRLSLVDGRKITRVQSWAQFIRGKAVVMPTVLAEDE